MSAAITRVTGYSIGRPGSELPPSARVKVTENWDSGRFEHDRTSKLLSIKVEGMGILPNAPQPTQIMELQEAEWSVGIGVRLISNLLLEVRPTALKGHGVGTLLMNTMVVWARRYHPGDPVLPIETEGPEPIGSRLIGFYNQFGLDFPSGASGYARQSNATWVRMLKTAPTPWLKPLAAPLLTVRR